MVGAAVHGFQADMNKRLPYDPEAAKKLLAEAGYPNGFEVDDELPERPLRQRRGDLPGGGRQPRAHRRQGQSAWPRPRRTYFPKILRRDTSFYLLGWTPSTVDSHDVL